MLLQWQLSAFLHQIIDVDNEKFFALNPTQIKFPVQFFLPMASPLIQVEASHFRVHLKKV